MATDGYLPREQRPYRPCVGIMLLNVDGQVFTARRNDSFTDAWQMPQGGIDPGEEPRAAAFRELEEEIGTNHAELLAETEDWLTYELPDELLNVTWKGRYRGQKQKWFALRFLGSDSDINLETEHPEFVEWRWTPMAEVPQFIVPFKRDVYVQVVARFAHLGRPL